MKPCDLGIFSVTKITKFRLYVLSFWKPVKMTVEIYINTKFIAQYFPKFFNSMTSSIMSYVVSATHEYAIPMFLSQLPH